MQGDPNPSAVKPPTQPRLLLGQVPDKPTKLFDRQLWPQLVCMSDLATNIDQTRRP